MACLMFVQISFVVMMVVGYLVEPSDALKYYVGGKEGWSVKPSKTFNHWASLNRFQVHDTLIFEYENGTDSVLQVDQEDYITCNKRNPILALENKGDYSTFDLDHSGFFFFISGHADNCQKGEKVIILVMAPRNYTHISPTSAPSPSQQVSAPAPSVVHGISPVSSRAPSPFQGISPSPFQGISPVSSQAPSQFQGISPVSGQAPSQFQGISPVSSQAPSPFQGISPVSSPAPSPVHRTSPVTSPAPAPSRVSGTTHHHTHSPAPAPSRVSGTTHHHTTHSPAPSPLHGASHVQGPAPSPVQQITSPAPTPVDNNSPAASPGPSEAAAPGPSDQAPSPDDGKSAAGATSFGGDLVMAVVLIWMIFK